MAINRLNPDYPDAGMVQLVPSSVAVGSGSATVNGNGQVSFSGASSISLNDVFSATYDNYILITDVDSASNSIQLAMRMRVSGADNSSNNYYWVLTYIPYSGTATVNGQNGSGLTNLFQIGYNNAGSGGSNYTTIFQPYKTALTSFQRGGAGNFNNDYGSGGGGNMSVTTSYTGLTVFPLSGTLTGRITIYGLRS